MSRAPTKFVIEKNRPAVVLAPMEGVTDYPMRTFLNEVGYFSFSVSEFIRVSQEPPPAKVFYRHVPELHQPLSERPHVQIQILGGDPEKMAASALVAVECGAQAVDINFGCPAPTVNRHDGGATLLKHPCRIEEIVRAVREVVPTPIPVSAKLRLGWDDPKAIHENAERAARGGAAWITIHGRTRLQGYVPPAYWKPIGDVKKALDIPVVANGEIWDLDDFKRCRDECGAEHFMLGRGALADPLLSRKVARELGLSLPPLPCWVEKESLDESLAAWAPLLTRFSEIASNYFTNEGYVARRLKQWAKFAEKRGRINFFEPLKRLERLDEIENFLNLPYGYLMPQPYAEVDAVVTGFPAMASVSALRT